MKDEFRPGHEFLSKSEEDKLSQNYHVSYVFTFTKENLERHVLDLSRPPSITEVAVTEKNLDLVVEFINKSYYQKFSPYFSAADIKAFADGASIYFAMGILGRLYQKNGTVVGCFLANRFEQHNLLPISSVHVGYNGYNRMAVTIEEARYIKNNWFHVLLSLHRPGDYFDVSVQHFNIQSIVLWQKIKSSLVGIRLKSKLNDQV